MKNFVVYNIDHSYQRDIIKLLMYVINGSFEF